MAFSYSGQVVIDCHENSYAKNYAVGNQIDYVFLQIKISDIRLEERWFGPFVFFFRRARVRENFLDVIAAGNGEER